MATMSFKEQEQVTSVVLISLENGLEGLVLQTGVGNSLLILTKENTESLLEILTNQGAIRGWLN
jgi:hypothetical protein